MKGKKKGSKATQQAAQTNEAANSDTNVQSNAEVTGSNANASNMENNTQSSDATVSSTEVAKPKRIPQARVFIGGVVAAITSSVDSVKAYVHGFMTLNVGARKGYDNYWAKEDGFTNPESIMKLTPQGLGKMLAVIHHRAALYIAEGGDNAVETLAVLDGIAAYQKIAVAEAQTVAQQKLFADALATMTKANGGDEAKARAMLAAMAQTAPAATVATSQTIGSSEPLNDAEDEAPVEEETANA